ncbi:MAG: protein-L-isoaspartate(D-aspartate) O-methyltransferase [Methanobacteriota archaeon]
MDFASKRLKLVERLIKNGYLKTDSVISAMRKVPRELFLPLEVRDSAYVDTPLPIGHNQTISAPHMVAIMTESLKVESSNKILEIGSGSGYQAAVLAEIAQDGFVYTVERIKPLVEWAEMKLHECGFENAAVFESDGTLGLPGNGPYDRVIVTAAAPRIPNALVEQLAEGGLLLVPVGGQGYQELKRVTLKSGELSEENLGGCVFVPLIGKDGW